MSTTKCGHTTPCGCADVALTTPAPCNPVGCPDPYPCSETNNAQCIIYTGNDILCGQTVIVSQDMNVAEALEAITDYFCNSTGSISANILCGLDIVVTAGTSFANAFQDIVDYFCNNSGLVIVEGDNQTINVSLVGNTYTVSQVDTGWVNLEGFNYYQGGMASNKPQVRRIGKNIHFRGNLIIPITDGSNVIPITTIDTYRTVLRKSPFAGTGGVYFDADDNMYFNSTGSVGGIVIPTSVLPTLTNLDGSYKLTREVASRQLEVYNTTDPDIDQPGTALLHAPVEITITSNKQLKLSALSVLEQNSADLVSFVGSSSLRNITSSFSSRQPMLDFKSFLTSGGGLNSMKGAPIDHGSLIIGSTYYIKSYVGGDNFTNVGGTNSQGDIFKATGTTPTSWLNGSVLYKIVDQLQSYDVFYPNLSIAAASSVWPTISDGLGIDGASPYDIGGYVISLDGLVAFIS